MRTSHHVLFSLALLASLSSHAQMRPDQKDMTIDATTKKTVIAEFNQEMRKKYVFPEVAEKVGKMLQKRWKNGDYQNITSAIEFTKALNEHVLAEANDKHLGIRYEERAIPVESDAPAAKLAEQEKEEAEEKEFLKSVNYGVERLERLPGNVGYLDLRGFGPTEIVGNALNAAMSLLNASDALIIDLRKNGGGSPTTVAMLASYFAPADTHLSDIYNRAENTTRQIWSSSHTATPRYDKNKQVYVLTSKRTFSAAEDFSYTLQTLKRSITVGEVSGGGAHPVAPSRLDAHFMARIPFGRSINPITKGNWEGVGVIPDVKVEAEAALKTAHELALKELLVREKHPGKKRSIERSLKNLQTEVKP